MGHSIHNVASLNGISIGFVRYDPAGQQPRRAVLDPRLSNALIELPCVSLPARDSHAPPHNVRVNPLLKKTNK